MTHNDFVWLFKQILNSSYHTMYFFGSEAVYTVSL